MGGKKKQSLRQMEKAQKQKSEKREKRVSAAPGEKKSIPGISLPKLEGEKLMGELKKMKVLTPHAVASRFNLRLSIARDFLGELEREGLVEFVSKSRNLKIYKPTS